MSNFTDILRSGVNILFPDICPVCEYRTTDNFLPICSSCMRSIRSGSIPVPASSEFVTDIRVCRAYNGNLKKCIQQLKYRGKRRMTRVFIELIREHFSEDLIASYPVDLIIPVPVSTERYRLRGFNQSCLIAKTLPLPLLQFIYCGNLIRMRNTPPQTGLSKSERMQNLKGAFAIKCPSGVDGKKILLVDDVVTTGATLDTCAKELLSAGAYEVHGFAVAKTLR